MKRHIMNTLLIIYFSDSSSIHLIRINLYQNKVQVLGQKTIKQVSSKALSVSNSSFTAWRKMAVYKRHFVKIWPALLDIPRWTATNITAFLGLLLIEYHYNLILVWVVFLVKSAVCLTKIMLHKISSIFCKMFVGQSKIYYSTLCTQNV